MCKRIGNFHKCSTVCINYLSGLDGFLTDGVISALNCCYCRCFDIDFPLFPRVVTV